MSSPATLRALAAAERSQQRQAQKRQRELERQMREDAKLTAAEQARLEVTTFENRLEVLLSVHRQQGAPWDWSGLASLLLPPTPVRSSHHETRAHRQLRVAPAAQRDVWEAAVSDARHRDEQEYAQALGTHAEDVARREHLRTLARQVLAGETRAYAEALSECTAFEELSDLGSALHFTVHSPALVECELTVSDAKVIPGEVKTLTAGGKVAVKPMPKARFQELYLDHVCACMLRVGRELFALLPIQTVLVTAAADLFDPRTGQDSERPVLSAVLSRETLDGLDFERLQPSAALEGFPHRGNPRALRKAGNFEAVVPLTPTDLTGAVVETANYQDLLLKVQGLRGALGLAAPSPVLPPVPIDP